jgi:alpha-L-fucosidase
MTAKNDTIPKPLPRVARFEKLGFGMFLHWGLYSQVGKGEWFRLLGAPDKAEYDRLIDTFTAVDFDARAWARLARESGMRYITLTTRHHDGFSLYDTRGLSGHDAPHSPAGRDLIAEFADGCRAEGIVPFFYHTTLDWRMNSNTCSASEFDTYLDYLHASVEILCRHYGPIGGLWFDGNWSRQADWKEDRLYKRIRRYQPDAMIINNTGLGAGGRVGHPEIDSTTFEQALPVLPDRRGWSKYVAVEMCQTMNAHWGLGSNDMNFLSPAQIIENLALSRKAGGNYLLNVGPTAQGGIPDYEGAALRCAGRWVSRHGHILRNARPLACPCSGRDFVLKAGRKAYYFTFDLQVAGHANVTVAGGKGGPGPRTITGLPLRIKTARWLDNGESLTFAQNAKTGDALLHLTGYPYGTNLVVRVAELDC